MLTAYDYPTAKLLDEAGIPLILVGDSLGQVMLGYENDGPRSRWPRCSTTRAAVVRGARRALVVGDMPFLSYATTDEALENAGRFLSEAGAQAVKVEGGVRSARIDRGAGQGRHPGHGPHRLDAAGAANGMGGKVRVQGKDRDAGPGARSPTRSRSRRRAPSRSSSSSSRSSSPRRSPSGCASRRSASAPAPAAAARSRSSPTCSASATWHPRHAKPYADLRARSSTPRPAPMPTTSRPARSPAPSETVRMDDAVLDEVLGRGAIDRPRIDAARRRSRSTATSELGASRSDASTC